MSFDPFLDWAVLTVSFFITISLFWLGLMVLLNGNRRSAGTWLTGVGMLIAALFFTSHTAILGRGLDIVGFGMDFWWVVSWVPAVIAPLSWYAAMLWHSGFRFDQPHRHRPWVIAILTLAGLIVLLLIFANPLPNYNYVAGRLLNQTPWIAGMPLLILAYLVYSLGCYLLPLDLFLRSPAPQRAPSALNASREQARPWLAVSSVLLLLAGLGLAWTATWALYATPSPSLSDPEVARQVKILDLTVASLVALAITLLGRTIVAYEVFTGRPLPRSGFFRHWRSTVTLAAGYGALVAWTIVIQLRPLYSLMIATALMTLFYALFSWRNFAEREAFMTRLRPFVASQDLYDQLVHAQPAGSPGQNGDEPSSSPRPGNAAPQDLFEILCREVLAVRSAWLLPAGSLATLAGPPLRYAAANGGPEAPPPGLTGLEARFPDPSVRCLAVDVGQATWAVSLWNERSLWRDRRLGGLLLLSNKLDGSPFTEEEIEIAQTGGERLLDMLAGAEMARLAMGLLRQRIAQMRVLEGQGRRILHDEILPELHTAILYLSSQPATPEIAQAVETLSRAHRRISDLMRDIPPSVPGRLSQGGLVSALRSLLETDYSADFASVDWQIEPCAEDAARQLPLFAAEVVFFAARELIRNSARHGRGSHSRPLALTISLNAIAGQPGLELAVADNGIGLDPAMGETAGGNGLRFHSAMLAAVGGSLEINSLPAGGVRAVLRVAIDHSVFA